MADATVASSPPRGFASTGDAVASPSRSAEDAGTRDEGDDVGTRRERVPVPVSEMATRLRVSEATVEALEEALAAKARALAEAATREARLRTDLDAARLGLVPPSAGDVPGDDPVAAPATEDPSAHPALRRWRDRARAAESARDDAERRAARLARENAALVSMLERYRGGTHPDPAAHPDPTDPNQNPPASIRDEMRVAVAEGELASCRARLRAAETALDDWRAHAANLSDRLAVAEASAAAADAAGPTRADVEALARRVEEAERLAATAVAAAANTNPNANANANANKTPVASPSSVARRRRADANDARLEQSRRYLDRANAAATVVPAPTESESGSGSGSGSGSLASALVASSSARAASGANAALAEALAAARRVSETAERRAAAGAEALRRAAALEKSASRRLALGPAAAAVVDVRRAVESIERAVAEAE